MRGRVNAIRTFKGLVADLRINITPMKLEQQIEYALQNKTTLTQKAKELCDFFERKNREINKIADMLIERAGRNRYNSCRLRPHTY